MITPNKFHTPVIEELLDQLNGPIILVKIPTSIVVIEILYFLVFFGRNAVEDKALRQG